MRKLVLIMMILAAACGDASLEGHDESFGGDAIVADGSADGLGVTPAEATAILALVNSASHTVLDDDVRLDSRAAANIVRARRAGDIASLDELDAIAWVGTWAFTLLRQYVRDHNLVAPAPDCFIISEYIEGKTDKNKAVELHNCGTAPIDLSTVAICLIRNDDKDCTLSTSLGERELPPNGTITLCRQRVGQWKNPEVWIADACEVEIGSTAIFSGDDRLALVRDTNADGVFSVDDDEVLDALGRFSYRPSNSPWNDVRLQRCKLEPNDGRHFYATEDWFKVTSWSVGSGSNLGVAPTPGGCR